MEVSTEPSSTSEPPATAVVPDSTVPGSTVPTTDATPPSTVGNFVPSTPAPTTTTQPPHDPNDLSMLTIAYEGETGVPNAANIAIPTGQEKPFAYTITNTGSWQVQFDDCVDQFVSLWTTPATQAWPPYSDGIWPMPSPSFTGKQPDVSAGIGTILAPGASETRTVTLLADTATRPAT